MSRESQPTASAPGFAENPAATLERVFTDIYQHRMQDLPVVNTAIRVEAIDFHPWEGHWLGVLITPWFMNLFVVPKQGSPWPEALRTSKGKELPLIFPQGEYKFSSREEPGVGPYLSCSLASPVHEWKSHLEIRKTARDVLRLIKSIPVQQIDTTEPAADNANQGEKAAEGCAMSRRDFFNVVRSAS